MDGSIQVKLLSFFDVLYAFINAIADTNEEIIAENGGIEPIVKRATEAVAGTLEIPSSVTTAKAASMRLELQSQCARALRNLSVRCKS